MIPTAVLPHRVTVEPYESTAGNGTTIYGRALRKRGLFVGKRRAVKTSTGVDVIGSGVFLMRPDDRVVAESKLTRGTRTYTVLDVAPSEDALHPHHVELILEGPR